MRLNIIINMVIGILFCSLVSSCEKPSEVYNSELAAVRFFLDGAADSTVYSFALHPGIGEDTLQIPVQILGFTTSQSRQVKVVADNRKMTAIEGNDFDLMPCVIPADSIGGVQKVIIRKTAELNNEDRWISLKLTDSPDLAAGPVNELDYRIILTNQLIKPSDWLSQFGEYSRVKHEFVIKVTGKGTNYAEWKYQYQFLTYYIGLLNNALYDYNNAHPGHPLVDENGIPIEFPG